MERYNQISESTINYCDCLFESYIKEYLAEKTFNIGKDVDYIYNRAFKSHIDRFNKTGKLPDVGTYDQFSSKLLKSKTAQQANKSKPIIINCGIFKKGSYYSTLENIMFISLNLNAIQAYRDRWQFSPNDTKSIENEITEVRVKATTYHELSHWLSDTLHNFYIYDLMTRAYNMSHQDVPEVMDKIENLVNLGKKERNITHYEIDAQIHALKQLKRTLKKEWDSLNIIDLFYKYSSLRNIGRSLYKMDKKLYTTWIKDLIKRMNREGILGKSMRNIPEYHMFESRDMEELLRI